MFVYILLIGLIIFILWMLIPRNHNIIKNKQIIKTIPEIELLNYPEGDYGKYPYILYEKRNREHRLYDSLTYDFYHVSKKVLGETLEPMDYNPVPGY